MLDDHDREKLRKIQNDLSAEDPTFVRSFEMNPPPPRQLQESLPYTAAVWVFVAASIMAFVSLALGTPSSAVVFFVVAGIAAARELRSFGQDHRG